jgi:hypothetical protein
VAIHATEPGAHKLDCHLLRLRAAQRVVDRPRVPPRVHQPVLPQPRQLLRQMRLPHPQLALQRPYRALAMRQMAENQQPVRVRHAAQEPRQRLGMVTHQTQINQRRLNLGLLHVIHRMLPLPR